MRSCLVASVFFRSIDELLLDQRRLGIERPWLSLRQACARAVQRGLELVGVELGEHLADFHRRVVIDEDAADRARQFA